MGANISELSGGGAGIKTNNSDKTKQILAVFKDDEFIGSSNPNTLFTGSSSNAFSSHSSHQNICMPGSGGNYNRERKRKFWWRRRNSRSNDPGRSLRDVIQSWNFCDIVALVQEYEIMACEKELYIQSESSRPRPQSIRSDLADLLDFKWNSDVNLILAQAIFPAHRPILMQRSKFFRSLLQNTSSSQVANVNIEDTHLFNNQSIDIPTFSSFLRFLYTEETQMHSSSNSSRDTGANSGNSHGDFIPHLDLFGRPRNLEADLRELLQTSKYSDVILVFGDEQFPCHKCILAARSPFFRSLIQRRTLGTLSNNGASSKHSRKIILDESVIPKRYARVILQCMYTDRIDLSLIDPARSGLTEVESLTFTGRLNPAGFEEAMELFQIGRFIELDQLCQLSEDIIIEQLSYESLPSVLRWSSQPHGSQWVRRQALMFLREEYYNISQTQAFLELDKSVLHEVLQSDFLQASEADILQSILRWGEHQLIRRVEDREPNLLTTTRDSVTRKGIKRRDLSDVELREIVGDLLRLVRTDHILLNNEILVSAVRRGLVSIPPSHMITEEKTNVWINTCRNYHIRPRLYTPFYEEAKSAIRHRTTNAASVEHHLNLMGSSNLATMNRKTLRTIPDTLYMIDSTANSASSSNNIMSSSKRPNLLGGQASNNCFPSSEYTPHSTTCNSPRLEDIVVDPELMTAMLYREKKLRSAHQRALNYSISSRETISRYIRLRVVREFGYPDYVAQLLETIKYSGGVSIGSCVGGMNEDGGGGGMVGNTPSNSSHGSNLIPPTSCSDVCQESSNSKSLTSLDTSHLSEKMPDVAALAAAHDMNLLSEDVLHLDLGDGFVPQRAAAVASASTSSMANALSCSATTSTSNRLKVQSTSSRQSSQQQQHMNNLLLLRNRSTTSSSQSSLATASASTSMLSKSRHGVHMCDENVSRETSSSLQVGSPFCLMPGGGNSLLSQPHCSNSNAQSREMDQSLSVSVDELRDLQSYSSSSRINSNSKSSLNNTCSRSSISNNGGERSSRSINCHNNGTTTDSTNPNPNAGKSSASFKYSNLHYL